MQFARLTLEICGNNTRGGTGNFAHFAFRIRNCNRNGHVCGFIGKCQPTTSSQAVTMTGEGAGGASMDIGLTGDDKWTSQLLAASCLWISLSICRSVCQPLIAGMNSEPVQNMRPTCFQCTPRGVGSNAPNSPRHLDVGHPLVDRVSRHLKKANRRREMLFFI